MKRQTIALPIIGVVPKSAAKSPAIKSLVALVESIVIVNGVACWDHEVMFDLRDHICEALNPVKEAV